MLRPEICLTKGRREVKRVLGKCLFHQRQRVGPCSQRMAQLPSERVSSAPAFTHVGIGRCLYEKIPPPRRLTFALSRTPVLA